MEITTPQNNSSPHFKDKVSNAGSLNRASFEKVISGVEDYAILLLDPIGNVLTWNKGAERIKGYLPEEIIGRNFQLFYTKEDKENGLPDRLLQQAFLQGKADSEGWRIRRNGTRFWASITLTALHDEKGDVSGFLKISRDLTDKKIGEEKSANYLEQLRLKNEALKQSEDKYHKMVAEVNDYAIILLDREGSVVDWNKGATKLKGYSAEEIVGKSFRLFYPLEDKQRKLPEKLLQEAAEKGSITKEGWRIKKDGSRFWGNVTITALHDEQNQIIGYCKVTNDLTDKKTSEEVLNNFTEELKKRNEELKLSEERYHKMIAEVQDYAILLLDKNGIIQNWNAGAQILKGYKAEEIIGRSFKVFYSECDREEGLPDRLLDQAIQTGRAAQEGWRVKMNGTKFWASVVITALHNNNGELIGFSKVTRDLTERKQAEDIRWANMIELETKNKVLENLNKELSSFAYIVSHDLKEPVRKIQVFATRIKESGKTLEQIYQFADKIDHSAIKMQNLMLDLLSFTEMTIPKELGKVDLQEIFITVQHDLETLIEETHTVVHSDKLPTIKGIPHQLHQLFVNLLTNAIKFRRPEEVAVVQLSVRVALGIDFSLDETIQHKSFYEITFADNGIGFDPQYANKIFEVFYRLISKSDVSGSGIGLAIVNKVMVNHFGLIKAESEPGKGARFKIYFPKPEF